MLNPGNIRLILLALAVLLLVTGNSGPADAGRVTKYAYETGPMPAINKPGEVSGYSRSPGSFAPFLPAEGSIIAVAGSEYSAVSDINAIQIRDGSLVWNGAEDSWVDWKVTLPEGGLYRIGIVFDTIDDREDTVGLGFHINGRLPFREAEHLSFKREFVHDAFPPKRDEFDNDIRMRSEEAEGWKVQYAADYRVAPLPLQWEMSDGENTIRLLGRGHPLAIKEVRLLQAGSLQESGARAEREVGENIGGWYRLYEAEQIGSKSDASIQLQTADSVKVTPPTEGRIRFNVIGGEQFRRSGEWIEWEFEVPHEGDYEIGFKFMQNFINNFYSCRSILIDGQALQEELGNQKFPYGTGWQAKNLEDGEGRPIRFRLSQGKHTLKMIATAYPVAPIYEGIEGVMKRIADLEFAVRKVTGNYEKALSGGNADANRDWELEAYVPDLQSRLKTMGTELLDLAERAKEQSVGGASDIELALRSAARELADLGRRPAQIPNELGRFATMQKNLSQWLYRMMDQPLLLDSFWVAEPAAKLPRLLPNGLETFGYAIKSFFRTFRIDYDFRRDDPGAIEVWVNRNRDYVALIGRLAAESFTPQTGIAVNINIVPDPQMFVLGNAAGIQPDVALGVDQAMPVDFASRGALLDLSQFADYSEAAASFHPGALRAFHYKHGDYALPENQGFHMLAYRTDILEGLGLKPPDTWEEMYRMLPNLQQNGYDFYLNPKDFQTFIYQNGGELYEPDGMSSGLESEEAYTGFRQWTEMFTLYQLPREVPSFFSHFRQGTIPIGIIDFNAYLQLQFAAPEIAGKWKIAAIPGTRQPDGSIARWSGGGLQGAIIFSKTDKKKEAWEFLKWWTSEETQERFGSEVEALFGPEYRWNTANRLAFRKLPWPAEHLRAIEEQMRWFKEAPQVPGGYFTARQVDFAWNSVVINRRNIRESLEKAVLDINREMARKQTEFRLRDRLGGIMEPLDVPAVTKPGRIEGGPRHEIE